MPQPLSSKLQQNPNMVFFGTSGLMKRPELAIAFAEAMEEFAVCEGEIGAVYLVLNASRPDSAYRELEENVTFSSRIQLVENCVKNICVTDRALILAVTRRALTAAKVRNKIAHCRWGYSDALPTAVLSVPIGNGLRDIRERLKEKLGESFAREVSETNVMVYEKHDFETVRLAALNAGAPMSMLASYIMSSEQGKTTNRNQILSDPQTKDYYDKLLVELGST